MYPIEINFLNDRQTQETAIAAQPIEDTQFLIGGGAIFVVALAAAAGFYFYLNFQIGGLEETLATLTSKEQELDKKLAELANSEKSIQAVTERTNALAALFTQDLPTSAVLQDLAARTPGNIQIKGLTLAGKNISLSATATGFNEVNDYMLLLQASPYLNPKSTQLGSAKRRPDSKDVPVQLVDFDITAVLADKKVNELLPELQKSGADGVVTRITTLQEKGVFAQ